MAQTASAGSLSSFKEMVGVAMAGQTSSPSAADKTKQSDDLLRRARQAMAENDLSTAESLVSESDALNVDYGNFYTGDTPKKVRRDLERKRNAAASTKPSQFYTPLAGKKPPTGQDPFLGRTGEANASDAAAKTVTPLPKVAPMGSGGPESSGYALSTDQNYPTTSAGAPGQRDLSNLMSPRMPDAPTTPLQVTSNGDPLLAGARKALAVGDINRAEDFIRQARAKNQQYGPLDDSPEKIEIAIRNVKEMKGLDRNSEGYRRMYARTLIEQADALIRHGEFDEAERLADMAVAQRVAFSPFETKPEDVKTRLATAKRSRGMNPGTLASNPNGAPAANDPHAAALALVRQSRDALAAGQYAAAEEAARRALQLRLPESAFGPNEDRPSLVMRDILEAKMRDGSRVMQAGNYEVMTAGGVSDGVQRASQAVYDPSVDPSRNIQVAAQGNTYRNGTTRPTNVPTVPPEAIATPEPALDATNPLTPTPAAPRGQAVPSPLPAGVAGGSAMDDAVARQQVLIKQISSDLAHQEANARAMLANDPKTAVSILEEARQKVEATNIDSVAKEQLLRRVDRSLNEAKRYVAQNQPKIDLVEKNDKTRSDIDREQKVKLEKSEKVAMLVDEFNRLVDEHKFDEAQVVAKRAKELDPDNPVVRQLATMSKMIYQFNSNDSLKNAQEEGFLVQLYNVDKAAIGFNDNDPYQFNDVKKWKELTDSRKKLMADKDRYRTERDIEIERKLKTPVTLSFANTPLSEVLDRLAKLTDINIYLDPKGLVEEGLSPETPINIEIQHEIMLKSALNLILQPLRLNYVIKDEVLKVTSEQMRNGVLELRSYNVADLVIPIPNFAPGPFGMTAAYNDAMGAIGYGAGVPGFGSTNTPMAVVASRNGQGQSGSINPNLLAQISANHASTGGMSGMGNSMGSGPGGLGGGAQADWDSIINLIENTIEPKTWTENGGEGTIERFETNLSLVVSQTQEVHEKIADLLDQLRRMQDLQVTIEVRFISLADNFFERIGVDFDFDIHNYGWAKTGSGFGSVATAADPATGTEAVRDTLSSTRNRTAVVGLSSAGSATSTGTYSSDLDVPFRQNSYGLAVPQFGGFDPAAGASLGFAILSDIEAYFFVTAAQGDSRTNILQAPKVTLFNGQQATVRDQVQSPFVMSVIPVVGDFAAAQQPVIVVLSEGTFMTVQAVVSQDKRFVRLTVVPSFSSIDSVSTFTFTGTTTTTTETTRDGVQTTPNDNTANSDSTSKSTSGTTVQLPTISVVSVTTTVSVPDGGTVLLGGIKRLSESRNEYGVPMLNKIPYLNRLFKNVSIGRETESLMMMVTPRIIIQEEEENKLGINSP